MTFTVRSLLDLPAVRTRSLTPGVGEDRAITWAHVCELPDPWRWLGDGALVMTTGIGVPRTTDEQCGYLRGMQAVGIAAVAVDEQMMSAPFTEPALAYASHIGFPVLSTEHEVPYVALAMAVAEAVQRSRDKLVQETEQRYGALLLAELCTGSLPADTAARLVEPHGVRRPALVAVAQNRDPEALHLHVRAAFAQRLLPSLTRVEGDQVLMLAEAGDALEAALEAVATGTTRVGTSAPFDEFDEVPNALLQARSALIRNHLASGVLHFGEHETTSLFLPSSAEQLRRIANQVLGPLRTYDEQRGTSLTQTLRVFLEENRSWVRAAERLFVHRQTLIARISRIEKIIDRDLSSIEDTAECWLAVQAAIGCGDLEPDDAAAPAEG
ncbi:PucR family transcriptional regulator [Leucobacter tenebrionis]|uniref:PucR family transcriptional regulator n=1 Tax=Leucobacter tenebrionis TaxID=2873270 RepID=UPI001CA6051B|nr:PucR family transcriptional regulator [Leucobacter tenebrionis]QZY53283.1 PucR family transcriptional regulator ligand-binding domain-containing protein [Leucobacter tenebrionis]